MNHEHSLAPVVLADRRASTSGEPVQQEFPGTVGLALNEGLVFERSSAGACGIRIPDIGEPELRLPPGKIRGNIGLPEISEPDAVRHYTRLSTWNYGVDTGFYPLGSCTMKYNPKVNEQAAALAGFRNINPYQPAETVQGALDLMMKLEEILCELFGLAAVSLIPSAGAQGEFTGLKIIKAYHQKRGEVRRKMLIPDTAHGTNPATCTLNGFDVVKLPLGPQGYLRAEEVAAAMDGETAGIMITNPNTLGLFEKDLSRITAVVHERGGLVYLDGANFNALMGYCKPGLMGIDIMHVNLHKTFSTPHGGGGPGSGPVGVRADLEQFLPMPRLAKDNSGTIRIVGDDAGAPDTIGLIRGGFGNFGVLVRAYTYCLGMGNDGLTRATEIAVLNANYILAALKEHYDLPFGTTCMHECVFSDKRQQLHGIKNTDIAKGLIDRGFHPPTMSFPLVVPGAIMIEPTETEGLTEIDAFIRAMIDIAEKAVTDPASLLEAPKNTRIGRVNETLAARQPMLCEC